MLSSAAASSSSLKNCALLGFKAAYFHASSICHEKRAEKFRSAYKGNGHKDYVNYAKRKKRAEEKRDLLKWRSCEIHIGNFEELYWSCGVNSYKTQKKWTIGKNCNYKESKTYEGHFGCKKQKRSGQQSNQGASQRAFKKDPFQCIWQNANIHYDQCWGDFFSQEFRFASDSPFSKERSSTGGFSGNSDYLGKKKVKTEPPTIGSPSDRQALGLSPFGSLTMEELKKAFRSSALKWHPDRHEDAAKVTAEAKFKDCGAAYKSLLNALAKS